MGYIMTSTFSCLGRRGLQKQEDKCMGGHSLGRDTSGARVHVSLSGQCRSRGMANKGVLKEHKTGIMI